MNPITKFCFVTLLITLPQVITARKNFDHTKVIKKACKDTGYDELCFAVLESDPQSEKITNLPAVVGLSLKVAASGAFKMHRLLVHHLEDPKSPKLSNEVQKGFAHCVDQYEGAFASLVPAFDHFLLNGPDAKVFEEVRNAILTVQSCKDVMSADDVEHPPKEYVVLVAEHEEFLHFGLSLLGMIKKLH